MDTPKKYVFYNDPKFRTLVIDAVATLLTFFGGRYLSPDAFESVKVVWGVLQPMFILVLVQQGVEQFLAMRAKLPLKYFK